MDPVSLPIHQLAPTFSLPDLQGDPHSLQSLRGRIAILNFWSAECPWAGRADDELVASLPAWGKGVALWSIASNANEPAELLARVAAEHSLPVVLHDAEHHVADLYHAVTTPHLFVLDRHGILRYQGALDDTNFRRRTPTRHYLHLAVESLLAGGLPEIAESNPYGCAIVRELI
jgi:peroxiredoxin